MGLSRVHVLMAVALVLSPALHAQEWRRLADLPDRLGVAGAFAGETGGGLLVAGGAHFPGKPPWEGGRKVWTDSVWWLDRPDGAWTRVGSLPGGLGYGVAVTHRGWVVCAGGSDSQRHHTACFRLRVANRGLERESLPPLPQAVANGCGALLGDTLWVVGGQEKPDGPALDRVYSLDLGKAGSEWVERARLPGKARILATAGATDTLLVVAGGAALEVTGEKAVRREYLADSWQLEPGRGWKRLADLPKPLVASPGPMPFRLGDLWLLGGDDGRQVGLDPREHTGFERGAWRYNPGLDTWKPADPTPFARVTAPVVAWRDLWVVPSGEMKPGIRSPEVWACAAGGPANPRK